MRRSTKKELEAVENLVSATKAKIDELIRNGKKVHIIWDFDGVLADSRSEDVFALTGFNLEKYFAHEERLLLDTPNGGAWLLPVAHNGGGLKRYPEGTFTQDIVTARSSTLAIRVHMFCFAWSLEMRWMLFLGHQPKQESYRIILESLKSDPEYRVFCIDDNAKHIEAFQHASKALGMDDRTFGIVSPVTRTYTKRELKIYVDRVVGVSGDGPIRVRDPSDEFNGFIVLPEGLQQFKKHTLAMVAKESSGAGHNELRQVFVNVHGEVGKGTFKTEKELEQAMRDFIVGRHCP